MNERLNTIPQTCDRLQCGRSTIYALIKDGQLRPIKLGKLTRIPDSEIDRYIRSLKTDVSNEAG